MKVLNQKKILITGGVGFIGTNAALHFHNKGHEVHLLDNFSRRGTRENERLLKETHDYKIIEMDIRDQEGIDNVIKLGQYDVVLHLAAQVAVTTSLIDPIDDFRINIEGTLFILEAIRKHSPHSHILFASTNKVYGDLEWMKLDEDELRYNFQKGGTGISEEIPLSFHSPYGCSKGAADQYVLDYCHVFGLKSTVFRQSCVYGQNQMGIEDQGWVAWFLIAAHLDLPLTVYGNGKQVRDLLHVDDLVALYDAAIENPEGSNGQAYNVGGGLENSHSLLEVLNIMNNDLGLQVKFGYSEARTGDQLIFVSDNSKGFEQLGWKPERNSVEGLKDLNQWIVDRIDFFKEIFADRLANKKSA